MFQLEESDRKISITQLLPTLMTNIINHEVHDGLRHQVTDSLVDDCHVGVDQVANGFHLSLQLRIHAVYKVVRTVFIATVTLRTQI